MTEEKKENTERELGFCTIHPAFPIPQGTRKVKLKTPFGIKEEEVNVISQEYPRCLGEACESSWCEVHGMCRHICEHNHNIHIDTEDEINRVFRMFNQVLTIHNVGNIEQILQEVQDGLEGENGEDIEENHIDAVTGKISRTIEDKV